MVFVIINYYFIRAGRERGVFKIKRRSVYVIIVIMIVERPVARLTCIVLRTRGEPQLRRHQTHNITCMYVIVHHNGHNDKTSLSVGSAC